MFYIFLMHTIFPPLIHGFVTIACRHGRLIRILTLWHLTPIIWKISFWGRSCHSQCDMYW